MVGPNYRRPELALPAAFIGRTAVAARPAPIPAEATFWWARFGDPLLGELVDQALAQNLEIAQAVARMDQAKAGLRQADAALLPSATISAQALAAHQSVGTPAGRQIAATPGFDRDTHDYEADLAVGWEIDLFGGLRRDREAAIADYRASRADAAAIRLAIAAQVADSYIAIRGLQARLAIAEAQVRTQQQLVDIVALRYRKGVAAELQLRQAEGALSQVKATLPFLQTALDGASNALDVLLGAAPGTYRAKLVPAAGVIPVAPAIADIGGPADLLRRRPDLIVAEQRLVAANAQIGSAISEYYPKLDLSGLVGTASASAGGLFTGAASQAQGIAGLRWRLFDFARVDAEIATAKGRRAEALAGYRLAVLRASEDVENAFSTLMNSEAQEHDLAEGDASLVRAQQTSLTAYKSGAVSLLDVLDADGRLLTTRDARAQAQTQAARAAVASFRALGGGWEASRDLPVRAELGG
jgi:NodT family efflux transporter outer membrane factor (OMF) lipoprotein